MVSVDTWLVVFFTNLNKVFVSKKPGEPKLYTIDFSNSMAVH